MSRSRLNLGVGCLKLWMFQIDDVAPTSYERVVGYALEHGFTYGCLEHSYLRQVCSNCVNIQSLLHTVALEVVIPDPYFSSMDVVAIGDVACVGDRDNTTDVPLAVFVDTDETRPGIA